MGHCWMAWMAPVSGEAGCEFWRWLQKGKWPWKVGDGQCRTVTGRTYFLLLVIMLLCCSFKKIIYVFERQSSRERAGRDRERWFALSLTPYMASTANAEPGWIQKAAVLTRSLMHVAGAQTPGPVSSASPRPLAVGWTRSGATGKRTGTQMQCWHNMQKAELLCHNASHSFFFLFFNV